MASPTHNSSGSNNGSNGNTELVIATVALVVSLFALICAVFQALNQYFATATGFTSCKPEVIGDWAQFTRRLLRLWQFRIEVQFRVPVIFVAPPDNPRGPLGQKPIHYVNGTEDSCAETHTWTVEEFDFRQDARRDAGDTREAIHTADSELVSWAALLMAAQRMERESDEWQRRILSTYSPLTPSTAERRHTLAIGVQEQTRSWDTMPASLRKPYATSAICHLIEIMAMLGVYWKEFDMSSNKFRAQGNGFNLTGTVVDGLGFAFTFNKTGKTWFQENRIVPNDSVKQLCFGFCPTIFRAGLRTTLYTDEPKDERTLQLATHAEVAEMLVSFGCNTNTVNYFRLHNEHTRYSHLFPITFEMLGMVGELLQIKQTAFTMLPNPTFSTWNKSAFSLVRLLQNFNEAVEQFGTGTARSDPGVASIHVSRVLKAVRKVLVVAVEDEESLKQQNLRRIERQRQDEVNRFGIARQPHLSNGVPANSGEENPFSARLLKGLHTLGSAMTKPFRWVTAWLLLVIGRSLLAVGVSAGEHLLPKKKPIVRRQLAQNVEERPSFARLLEILHIAIQDCDAFLGQNHPLVKHVFVLHLQEVLAYLNEPQEMAGSHTAESTHGHVSPGGASVRPLDRSTRRLSLATIASVSSSGTANAATDTEEDEEVPPGYVPLHAIDTASWADRHQQLMQLYGLYIRDRVRKAPIPDHLKTFQQARERGGSSVPLTQSLMFGHDAPAGLAPAADAGAGDQARGSVSQDTAATAVAESHDSIELNRWQYAEQDAGVPAGASAIRARGGHAAATAVASAGNARTTSHQPTAETAAGASAGGASATTTGVPVAAAVGRRGAPGEALPTFERATTKQDMDDIWCTLTFRMLCWLMLHDFHRKDVQISSKSDMYDSRMPVYLL